MPVDAMAFLRPYKREIPGKSPSASTSAAPSPRGAGSPQKRPPRPPPAPKKDDDDDGLAKPRPTGPYREYKLVSTSLDGWKYDVFKFDSRKPVSLDALAQPLRLNRKHPAPRDGEGADSSKGPITPMLGLDGKPVIGPDGNIVMMQDGRPIKREEVKKEDPDEVEEKPKEAGPAPKKRKPFQKKTRQIHTIPEEQRQLQREERYPWVLEDQAGQETWVGRIENAEKSSMNGLFLTATSTEFYFIPAHRWYKMQKRPNFKTASMEEVEAEYARLQKNHTLEFWKKRQQASQQAVAEAEEQGRPINLGHVPHQPSRVRSSGGQSLAAGGRRLKTVDKGGMSLFGDDDEEEVKDRLRKRREKELGEEGDLDEIEFEDEFADDEEKMNVDEEEDEEAKELEERIKRETRAANKLRQAGVEDDESDEDEDFLKDLTGAGKEVKKALRKLEKNAAYDSDEDKNPYLSSEDEEEDEEPPAAQPTGPDATQSTTASGTASPRPGSKPTSGQKSANKPHANGASPSRATSPSAPGAGSSLLAHRATSPKGKTVNGSSGSGPRATSPKATGSGTSAAPRATSPLAVATGSRATSPSSSSTAAAAASASKKRKAEEMSPQAGAAGAAPKKVKKAAPAGPPPGVISEALVVEWLREQSSPPTTMACISKFRPYLVDKNSKGVLTNIIKKVAELRGGMLTLRAGF